MTQQYVKDNSDNIPESKAARWAMILTFIPYVVLGLFVAGYYYLKSAYDTIPDNSFNTFLYLLISGGLIFILATLFAFYRIGLKGRTGFHYIKRGLLLLLIPIILVSSLYFTKYFPEIYAFYHLPKHGEFKTFYYNGNISELSNYHFGIKDGQFKTYRRDGKIREEEEYKNGEKHGKWVQYSYKGTKQYERNYVNGKPHGKEYFWRNNKAIDMELTYSNGMIIHAIEYYVNGNKSEEIELDNGWINRSGWQNKNGLYITWHRNGQMKTRGYYKKGNTPSGAGLWAVSEDFKVGKWEQWGSDGLKESEKYYTSIYGSNSSNEGRTGLKTGRWKKWHYNGQLVREYIYVNDKLNGKSSGWYSNGQKSWEANFKDGKVVGKWTSWHPNGIKWKEELYKNGVIARESTWVSFYDNSSYTGPPRIEGKREGKWVAWHSNGQLAFQGEYKDGELCGEYTSWEENGRIIKDIKYWKENGQIKSVDKTPTIETMWWDGKYTDGKHTRYFEDNQKSWQGEFKNNKATGLWTWWYPDGKKWQEGYYKDGQKHGEWSYFHYGGKISNKGNYVNGKKQGEWKFWWYKDGKYKLSNYKDGFLNGKVTKFYKSGQKEKESEYLDDVLNGQYLEWYDNGLQKVKGRYCYNKRQGLWTYWYKNGNKEREGLNSFPEHDKLNSNYDFWDLKNMNGVWTFWHENGKKRMQGKFKNGYWDSRLHGNRNGMKVSTTWFGRIDKWQYWDEQENKTKEEMYDDNGKLIKTIEYKDGKPVEETSE